MKKIFSSLLFIFTLLLSSFKNLKINTFFGGLVLGALFSLIVNISTVQVQEMIQKQRVLEAMENEILNNLFLARNVLTFNDEYISGGETNFLSTPTRYSRDLWEQSTDPLKYIAHLDKEVQSEISIYYAFAVPKSNATVEKADYLTKDKFADCFWKLDSLSVSENKECKLAYITLLEIEKLPAGWIEKDSYELLKIFHPTRDRLNNPFLRLIMGDEAKIPLSNSN